MRAVLIGAGEVGGHLVEALQGEEIDLITVDNDPEVIERLRIQYPKVRTVLGDVTDPQLRAELDLPNADRFLAVTDRVVPRIQRASIVRSLRRWNDLPKVSTGAPRASPPSASQALLAAVGATENP